MDWKHVLTSIGKSMLTLETLVDAPITHISQQRMTLFTYLHSANMKP